LLLGVVCALVVPALADAARKPRPVPTPDAKPDRAIYQEAQRLQATLNASPERQRKKAEWEKAVMAYRRLVARYPQSPYCDDALLAAGDLYRRMATRFKSPRYSDDAIHAYRMLVAEYPSSSKGDQALYAVVGIAVASGDSRKVAEAARAYLAAYPRSQHAAAVKAALKKKAPAQEAWLPKLPPPGLAQVYNLRSWSGESSTRVVLDVERQVRIQHDRIQDPDRLWIDLSGTRLHPNLTTRTFPVGDGLLEQVRIGQNKDDVVRVVLDFKDVKDHSIFYLENPTRLVVDVRGVLRPKLAEALSPSAEPYDGPAPTPSPAGASRSSEKLPDKTGPIPVRRLPAVVAPEPQPTPPPGTAQRIELEGATGLAPTPAPSSGSSPSPAIRMAVRAEPAAPEPPQVNRAGSYSLARQLGLGVKRIVIDAGHGGHDPGTIGHNGLQEKDLVLDVALRLDRLVRSELGAETLLTRSGDVFVPLEERTAIANSKGADLFLSIHANSSRNRSVRGIETYYLSFAQDPHAEEVAARENAVSAATIKDLQNLVKAITLNSKIDESRDFAASVQEAMIGRLRPEHPRIEDRGTRTAPFYVLIGANMPSVLAEIAFVSNPEEERMLKAADHRERIARSLLEGVRAYLSALNRTQTRKLTGTPGGPKLAAGGSRR
jgi:N-acetylmuramoyl-L-alanine amidase